MHSKTRIRIHITHNVLFVCPLTNNLIKNRRRRRAMPTYLYLVENNNMIFYQTIYGVFLQKLFLLRCLASVCLQSMLENLINVEQFNCGISYVINKKCKKFQSW